MNKFMSAALKEAHKAFLKGEVPVGCVIVKDEKILSRGHNLRETNQDSLAHAEIIAIKKACKKLGTWRLDECDIYVTLEPCPMCTGAIIQSRFRNLYFGALDHRNGSVISNARLLDNLYTQKINYSYNREISCSQILTDFFKNLRDSKNKN